MEGNSKSNKKSRQDCLFTWEGHEENVVDVIQGLCDVEKYFDCSLVCDGGQTFNVHRLILSSCSPFLNNILKNHPLDDPVITLDGVSSVDLKALVEYMYNGETTIPRDNWQSFFDMTKELQIVGLSRCMPEEFDQFLREEHGSLENESKVANYLTESLSSPNVDLSLCFDDENNYSVLQDGTFIKAEKGNNYEFEFINVQVEDGKLNIPATQLQSSQLSAKTFRQVFADTIEANDVEGDYIKQEDDDEMEVERLEDFDELNEMEESQEEILNDDEEDGRNSPVIITSDVLYGKLLKQKSNESSKTMVAGDNAWLARLAPAVSTSRKINYVLPNKSVKMDRKFIIKRPNSVMGKSEVTEDNKKLYTCMKCGNKYSHKRTLLHHIHWICDQPATYSCNLCPYMGKRKFQLKSHMKHMHFMKLS